MIYDKISLPSRQYKWTSLHEEIGNVNEKGLFHSRISPGEVEIQVEDMDIENNFAESFVKVVEPRQLELDLVDIT